MKQLFALLLLAFSAQSAVVNIALTNFTGTPLPSNTAIQLFYTNQPTVSGLWISTGKPIRVPAPYGVVSTNLMPGNYSMSVEGITWPQPLRFTVGTNESYNLTELVTNATVVTAYAPFVTGITNTDGTVTITPSNGKGIVTISASGSGGPTNGVTAATATNIAASVAAGTNAALLAAITAADNERKAEIYNASNSAYASAVAGLTNITLTGVAGLPAALDWLTNNTGSSTGAVASVNGLTGAVTLGAVDVGAQPASANGTNWSMISTNVIGDLRQEIADTTLDFVPQYGTENGTNWAAVDPADWRESKATKTLVVDAENGSDVTGARGRLDKPYASLAAASGASDPGDVILIRPGSNYVASSVWLKTNVTVRGFGAASRIYGDAGQASQAVLVITNSGVRIEDVWVSAAGTAIGYIGGAGNLAYATNVTLRRVHADGGWYGVAWTGDALADGNGHTVTVLMEACEAEAATNGMGVRILGHTNGAAVRMVNCNVTGTWDSVILCGCVGVIEGGRYIATQIDGITTGNYADVTVRNAYVRGGPVANYDLYNDGYPTSVLREDGVDYRSPEVGDEDYKITHVTRQTMQSGEVRAGSLVVSNGIAATNLTGTIDAARLGSGPANNTTVLYGDHVWRAPPGGSSAAVLIMDCSTGLVSYALSDRVPHVLIKSNATYNAEIVANGSTNTISGSLVWIDAQPVGATNWIIKW